MEVIVQHQEYSKKKQKYPKKKLSFAEAYFETLLQHKSLNGIKFKKHFSIGKYIIDFYSEKEKLAIELGCDDHFTDFCLEERYEKRNYLKSLGIKVICINCNDLFHNSNIVIERILSEFTSTEQQPGKEIQIAEKRKIAR